MAYHALITIDLNNYVTTQQRQNFYAALEQRRIYRKKLTTTFTVAFNAHINRATAEQYVRDSIKSAAIQALVLNYEAAFMVSDQPTIEMNNAPAPMAPKGLPGLLGLLGATPQPSR